MAERDYKNLQVAVASAYALGLLSGELKTCEWSS